jgi:uncharacterized protein YndB with AHSA1/START domain
MSDSTPAAGTDQEVLITRIFDAPRERVFKAWTDPDELAAWYGPEHMETPATGSASIFVSADAGRSRWSRAAAATGS